MEGGGFGKGDNGEKVMSTFITLFTMVLYHLTVYIYARLGLTFWLMFKSFSYFLSGPPRHRPLHVRLRRWRHRRALHTDCRRYCYVISPRSIGSSVLSKGVDLIIGMTFHQSNFTKSP